MAEAGNKKQSYEQVGNQTSKICSCSERHHGANSTLKEDIMNSRWMRCMISILIDLRLALDPVIFSVTTG